tara:strand:+ start:1026 stop:1253 length:228 start_codon:yes stop_codon:yes gene_type:complete
MAFIRSNYNSETVTKTSDSSQLATNYEKHWTSESGVNDSLGVWDDENNKYIPDGMYDMATGWLWPIGLDWSNYNG